MVAVILLTGSLMADGALGSDWRVIRVAPSGLVVPERLLRISITFSTPQRHGLPASVELADDAQHVIDHALYGEVFWSPDRRTATLLLHPARVKTGLIAHEAAGSALVPGSRVMLLLGGDLIHTWDVVAGGCTVPDLATWRINKPVAGTREALTLDFPGPIDALSRDLIAISNVQGHRIAGREFLESGEQRWLFTPAAPWTGGAFQVVIHPRLESPCGDEPGEEFEHSTVKNLPETSPALIRVIPTTTIERHSPRRRRSIS